MSGDVAHWSEKKQKDLHAHLKGMWALDVWEIPSRPNIKRPYTHHYRFTCLSPSLNMELKYAYWQKLERKEWNLGANNSQRVYFLHVLIAWLNEVAPAVASLLEKDLEAWEISLRSYLGFAHDWNRKSE